jgi:GxxExxY protein
MKRKNSGGNRLWFNYYTEMHRDDTEVHEDLNRLSHLIIGCAIEVHRQIGPGLLESAYLNCLEYELLNKGLNVFRELSLPIIYKDIQIDHGYRIDLLVESKVVVELKTVEAYTDVHQAQILTYLKLGNYPLGLLMNFHPKVLRNNICRYINKPL